MYRAAIESLYRWKKSRHRKPLIIEGPRQVGKTWLMKEFGSNAYTDTVYINFDSNSRMAELFASDLDTDRLIMGFELYSGRKIDPANTLLIFDEVQEVPRALSSLKYFCENAPQYHIVCAGSLLGIALHEATSFPVGKVDFLKLYPLSFKEFLTATFGERFAYEQDFSKHAPVEIVPKIRMIWNSIPSRLAKENKISRINAPGIPLKAYEDLKAFKLFVVDVGLLGCMTGLNRRILLDGNDLFTEFKGALTEQYVCQQFKTIKDLGLYYYTNGRGSCEVDFVIDTDEQIVPVEVKAEVNLKAKSLKTYREKFNPEISVRTSMSDYKKEDRLINLPLYAAEEICRCKIEN